MASTRNTRTTGGSHAFVAVTLLSVLVMLLAFGLVGHALTTQVDGFFDTIRSGGQSVGGVL